MILSISPDFDDFIDEKCHFRQIFVNCYNAGKMAGRPKYRWPNGRVDCCIVGKMAGSTTVSLELMAGRRPRGLTTPRPHITFAVFL